MRHRILRLTASILGATAIGLSSLGLSFGLTCVQHADVEQAAREALDGQHPLWAGAYIVGRVDGIEHPLHAPLTLTVTPTHVFGGEPADRIRLAARSDGPPDPSSWRIGGHYFLALTDAPELEGVEGFVAPCAPTFRITTAEQLDRLIRAAASVEVREEVLTLSSAEAPFGFPIIPALAVGVIGVGSWLAFGRRSRIGHRP
jgi:hypothetical protein